MTSTSAKVYLVGAGPGDPTLITLRGARLLARADVVLYDYLVNPLVLRHAAAAAKTVCLGRHGVGRLLTQQEINDRMIAAARQGQTVVRLKGGDPSVFARVAEETAALDEAGVDYEIVPGVTAALAASSYAGIPLTHRERASCVAFVTGQECSDKAGATLDLANLAKFPGTLVFYMGVTTAPAWAAELIQHGKSADTPVAIVRRGSLPEQETRYTTLGELPEVLATKQMRPPAVIIVGEVVETETEASWFTSRPLFGQTVLVTRPERQAQELIDRLTELGASVRLQPAIQISPVADWSRVDATIDDLPTTDWLVFSSANGVQAYLNRLLETGRDLRQLAGCRLAAIGPATATALAEYHLRVDAQPKEYRAEALAEELAPMADGKRFLLLRASRGREVLAEMLTAAGGTVEQVVVYQSTDVGTPDPEIAASLAAGEIDWVTVTSSAIARSLVQMFGNDLRHTKIAAISPLTAGVFGEAGYGPVAVAATYTTEGLLRRMLEG